MISRKGRRDSKCFWDLLREFFRYQPMKFRRKQNFSRGILLLFLGIRRLSSGKSRFLEASLGITDARQTRLYASVKAPLL